MLFRKAKKSFCNILIVEDEPLVAFENELRMADAGYKVVATVDTEPEALALIAQGGIELVLADVHLSHGGDGVKVARAAHAAGMAVLFVTGTCPIDAQQYALGCLTKPYNAKELVRAVAAVDQIIRGDPPSMMPPVLTLYRTEA